jgi:hypothetical protein
VLSGQGRPAKSIGLKARWDLVFVAEDLNFALFFSAEGGRSGRIV